MRKGDHVFCDKITDESVFKTLPDIKWRSVNGELVVLNLKSGEYFTFNGLGAKTWENIVNDIKLGDIADIILKDYNKKTRDDILFDIVVFIENLVKQNLVEQFVPDDG